MGLGTWLIDKSKKKQLENILEALEKLVGSVQFHMSSHGRATPDEGAEFVASLLGFPGFKTLHVENIADAAGGHLKGPTIWPMFAACMERARTEFPDTVARGLEAILVAAYQRAGAIWAWPPDTESVLDSVRFYTEFLMEYGRHFRIAAPSAAEAAGEAAQLVLRYEPMRPRIHPPQPLTSNRGPVP